ncbi:M10 family metallopeptidase [Pseudomonas sp. NFACC04-2]|uniref:M10 family metallopeptidase n=1 Tax=Pseudomonas sp. NFACC04-2 TaxID=1566242 RepID=UPI000908DE61|nr:M10 family metallopeptidase [Pseudomonas sp. NFACC04-2]SFW29921.1 Hemolysin-type calcium-binding repeat-containing protein [Pseudomonas sp. NFACC04-2]
MPSPLGYSSISYAKLTGNAQVNSLLYGTYWTGSLSTTSLTYSFMTMSSLFASNYSSENEYEAGYVLSSAQKNGIVSALGTWSSVANIQFRQVSETASNVGDLRFGGYLYMDDDTAAWGYFPGNTPSAGDVWLGPVTNNPAPVKGTYDYLVFMHEIGHALGLKHPFSPSSSNSTVLSAQFDDVRYTIMSYNTAYAYEPTTPMLLDIAAIQSLYGANTQWQTGNNTYSWAVGQSVFETIWDAGGNDTIDASNQLTAVRINLNEGQFSKIGQTFLKLDTQTAFNEGLAIAYGAKIENAIGSANDDTLIGNALANLLNGRAGKDTMIGGAGSDTYVVDNIGDRAQESSTLASEIDTVISSVNYTLGANIETLTLSSTANLNGTGNALSNRINGNAGANTLDGGGGIDTLVGAAGNDIYVVDNLKDVVTETSTLTSEIDSVRSSVSWALGANLENLILTGSAHLNGTGNALNNVLTGNAGNNVLNGGVGRDTLIGGAGNDTYVLDRADELVLVQENVNQGSDGLIVTYTASSSSSVLNLNLSNLRNVENVVLNGIGAFTVVGNELNNSLLGNASVNNLQGGAGNDVLDGGAGADTLIGGTGNDTYVVDNLKDIVSETSTLAGEIDTVRSSLNWNLGVNLENLTLIGSANLNGNGNALNNVLIGNTGNNVLSGGAGNDALDGSSGIDTLIGGTGNDTYWVDNLKDVVTETSTLAGEIDTVRSSVSWTLGANLETLILAGSALLNGTGNALGNVLIGNAGNNVLSGGAGSDTLDGAGGIDTLVGGSGNDTYVVDNLKDVVTETSTLTSEIDTVRSSVSWALGANLENLILTGSAHLNGTGNALNNVLTGNAGNNVLNGGVGRDTLIGGAGNDTYVLDRADELVLVQESVNQGSDGLIVTYAASSSSSVVNLNLSNLRNVENVILNGIGAFTVVGNELNNSLLGNGSVNNLQGGAGNDVLDGGAGADTLIGGTGNDTYVVDNLKDIVSETSTLAGEIDTVRSSLNWNLGVNLESLTLIGSANLNGNGNALNNVLIGNTGNNVLSGGAGNDALDGSSGIDTLIGGTGNDTYWVDNLSDVIRETTVLGSEIDTVRSSVGWILGANLENLTLTGTAFIGIGNDLDNVLIGNAGRNVLDGGTGNDTLIGGLGSDSLTGGGGSDRFVFNTLGELGTGFNRDSISDFSSLQGDKLDLSKLDANLLTTFADTFSFIDSNDFTAAGQLRFVDQMLYGNVNGDLGADFEIQLTGVNTLNANDLIV